MSGRAEIPLETKSRQRRASDPAGSAWVSANAGSGKTWVLSRRVIRLLLSGAPASKLLCLTFTKAAAATMSNRVFGELGRWAVMDDAELAREITDVEGVAPDSRRLAKARRLFAEAIETPGGLKIQTLHGFCEAILHQFPLEADLPGRFEILEDAGVADLLRQAETRTLLAAVTQGQSEPLAAAFQAVMDRGGEFGFREALSAVVAKREAFSAWIRTAGTLDAALDQLGAILGLAPGDNAEALQSQMLVSPHFPEAYLAEAGSVLGAGSVKDLAQAEKIAIARSTAPHPERLEAWLALVFTKAGERKARSSFATQASLKRMPDLADRFEAEADRLEALRDRLAGLATRDQTAAVLRLGDAVIGAYEQEKRSRGALDFDDLIQRTVDLLDRSDSAAWVQFKLDRGIDHILVDEAQDTSPRQWTIVERLSEEFFAGEGQRTVNRTLFAVGDEKQSIYSFQGAAPDQFSAKRHQFGTLARDAGARFDDIKLYLSFRSTPDVLAAVDAVFAEGQRAGVVMDPADYENHRALRALAPGRVEIWPMVQAEKQSEPEDWTAPLDRLGGASPVAALARRIADEIVGLLAGGRLEGTGRRIRPKDILILVRKRGAFVDAVNRVLKERGVAVAGADRLKLTDHIVVEDLIALGRVMLLADDDLSLAAVLKSPLFGWNDEQLFAIAHGRDGGRITLWAALTAHAEVDAVARLSLERLAEWRGRVDLMPPYEFFARLLGADGGRRRFVERLGIEADDILDEFLAHALAQERAGAAGLAGFLAGLEAASPVIKREMDEARDEVRVMTVHGSKGLEAGIVFLVDSGSAPVSSQHDPKLVTLPIPGIDPGHATALAWVRPAKERPDAVAAAIANGRRLAGEEYRRLLYVAMTRAADRLYACGYAGVRKPDALCWHQTIQSGLQATGTAVERFDASGEIIGWTWRANDLAAVADVADKPGERLEQVVPGWIDQAPIQAAAVRALTPSTADADLRDKDATERPAAANGLASARRPDSLELMRGTVMHKLLECLPEVDPADRRAAAARYLDRVAGAFDDGQRARILDEVLAVLDDPTFAALFGDGSRAEVPLVGTIATRDGQTFSVSGQIDRLVVVGNDVMILDFKTNRDPPAGADAVPAAYVTQMALYRHLLASIFIGKTIRAVILWTARPALVEISPGMLDQAAHQLTIS